MVFSHNAAYTLRPTKRTRKDEELVACANKGGLIAITAVPNSLSDDPKQTIECVLDHYDYMAQLVGLDNVAVGTDTTIAICGLSPDTDGTRRPGGISGALPERPGVARRR